MKVFGSFTWLLHGIAAGLVSDEDMANGLFVFGCKRIHAMDPGIGEVDERTWVRPPLDGHAAHEVLVRAILYAEDCGRCIWWRDGEVEQAQAVVDLLVLRGLKFEDCSWEHAKALEWRAQEGLRENLDCFIETYT